MPTSYPTAEELSKLPESVKAAFLKMYDIINSQQEKVAEVEKIASDAQKEASEAKTAAIEATKKAELANQFIAAIVESQGFEQTMEQVESMTMQLAGCEKASFYRLDDNGKFYNASGDYRNWHDEQSSDELRFMMNRQEVTVNGEKAFIPVTSSEGSPIGVIVTEDSKNYKGVDWKQFEKGSQFANNIALAIKKDIIHQAAITDPLTGLKNRAGNDEFVKSTVVKNLNEGSPVSIIMADIDHFKSVNDTYGHDAGDAILKSVAEIIQSETRNGSDCAFRFGGEEMIAVLNCDGAHAIEVAERIRETVEKTLHTFVKDGEVKGTNCTISMGVAQMNPELPVHKDNAIALFNQEFKRADNAVYVAKATGRNQVVAAVNSDKVQYLANKAAKLIEQSNTLSFDEAQKFISNRIKANDMADIERQMNSAKQNDSEMYNQVEAVLGEIQNYINPEPQVIFSLTENGDTLYFHANNMDIKAVMDMVGAGTSLADFTMTKGVDTLEKSEFDIINKLDNKLMMNINRDENTFKVEAGRKAIDIAIRDAEMPLSEARKIARLSKNSERMLYDMIRVKMGSNAISNNLVNNVAAIAKDAKKAITSSTFFKKIDKVVDWAQRVTKACAEHKKDREAEQQKAQNNDSRENNPR